MDWADRSAAGISGATRDIAEVEPLGDCFSGSEDPIQRDVCRKLRAPMRAAMKSLGGAFAGAGFYFGFDGV